MFRGLFHAVRRIICEPVGIDLGTTNSCVAICRNGKPVVVNNGCGKTTTPSVVCFTPTGVKVGNPALGVHRRTGAPIFHSVKRVIGKSMEEVLDSKMDLPFQISDTPEGLRLTSNGHVASPEEISAAILYELKRCVERETGNSVDDVVVTIPAYFNEAQRSATKKAAEAAGLRVQRVINEPTAAALAFGINPEEMKEKAVVVADLGGGTFDVSLLRMEDGVVIVKSTSGDPCLGGNDFDSIIAKHIGTKIHGHVDIQALLRAAEKLKIELSTSESASVSIPVDSQIVQLTISRSEVEEWTAPLLLRLAPPCLACIKDAGMSLDDISNVLLVGGMTRMPAVRQALKDVLKKEPNAQVDPDLAVATGAALQAAVLAGESHDLLLVDICPLPLGIEILGGAMSPVVPKNASLPVKVTEVFTTGIDNQESVSLRVYQGLSKDVSSNKLLGEFTISGLPKMGRGEPQVEVTFEVDASGLLTVSALEARSGVSLSEQFVRL